MYHDEIVREVMTIYWDPMKLNQACKYRWIEIEIYKDANIRLGGQRKQDGCRKIYMMFKSTKHRKGDEPSVLVLLSY